MTGLDHEFYERCSKVTEAYEKIYGRWHEDSQLLHIMTEIAELKDVLRNKNQKYGNPESEEYREKLLDELADVFLTSFGTANFLGINWTWLVTALTTKLNIVENRVTELQAQDTQRRIGKA